MKDKINEMEKAIVELKELSDKGAQYELIKWASIRLIELEIQMEKLNIRRSMYTEVVAEIKKKIENQDILDVQESQAKEALK